MKYNWRCAIAAGLLFAVAVPSMADDLADLRKLRDTTINLVNALVDQGVLTRAKADEIIRQAQQAATGTEEAPAPSNGAVAATPTPASAAASASTAAPAPVVTVAPGVVRVPYIPESVKQQIRAEVKEDVLAQARTERWGEPNSFPEWLRHFTWSGDLRLREQLDRFPDGGAPNAPVAVLQAFGVNIQNSTDANSRLRVRGRFGFEASVGDSVTVGLRVASGGVGAGSNPSSENQTLGTYGTRSSIGLDRAFIKYQPTSWLGLTGGRVANPYFRPTTLIWADDVSLDGLLVRFDPHLNDDWSFIATAGLFPILHNDPSPVSKSPNKWLSAYQVEFDAKLGDESSWRFGTALYDYRNIEGSPNPTPFSVENSGTAAPFRQTGNTVFDINGQLNTQNGTANYLWGIASKFRELNVSTSLDLGVVGATHLSFDADWVTNLGFKQSEILRRTGYIVDKQTQGWVTKLTVGHPNLRQRHAWQAWMGYRNVQRDATLDAFTETDFHLGGTDAKGFFLGARYAFEKATFLSAQWFSAKQVDGVELAGGDSVFKGLPLSIDVLQVDVMSSF
jgi:hypothetical protein